MGQSVQQIYSIRENDIFISYAPSNLLFAKKLDTEIRSLGHDPWIDLEDLPIGIDLNQSDLNQSIVWQYIKAGIENANVFVFILSTAFCQSQRNLDELEFANHTGKRLIPVRLEAIEPEDLPAVLTGIPQIIVNSDQPDATIDRIAQVVVYLHTYDRLQQKAQNWAVKTQDCDAETNAALKAEKVEACKLLLLRGVDLESVEGWIAQAEDLDRDLRSLRIEPTLLHNQYIAASRAVENAQKQQTETGSIYRPSYETYDVFISYSRRDKVAFVEQLCTALQEQGKKVWVDWQNIPVAAPWRQQIREGIIGANNFLFVISADSAASKNCREELIQAIENQKRLIGVMWRSDYRKQGLFDRESSLAELKDYNWIYFNDPAQEGVFNATVFEQSFPELLQAIEIDAAQVAQHTRLLMQAQEWYTHARNRDFLLTGKRLAEARQWLRQCSDKKTPFSKIQHSNFLIFWWKWYQQAQQTLADSRSVQQWSIHLVSYLKYGRFKHDIQPTELQQQYIQASYDVQQEKRIGLGVFFTGIMAALIALGLFGLTATRGKIEALVSSLEENQELDALVTGLRAGAELERYSLVLSTTDRNLPIRVITALQQQVYNLRERNRLLGHRKQVYNASFSADGKFLVSASEDGSIRLWNEYGKLLATAREDGSTTTEGPSEKTHQTFAEIDASTQTNQRAIVNAIFNPGIEAGTYLVASAGDGNEIKLWQVKQNPDHTWQVKLAQRLSTAKSTNNRIYTIQFSQGGQVLAAASSDGTVRLWKRNTANQFVLVQTLQQRYPVYALSFSPSTRRGEQLAFADAKGNIQLLTSQNLFQSYTTSKLQHGNRSVLTVQFSPNAQWLASGSDDGTIQLWDLQATPRLKQTLSGHEARVYRVAFSPNSQSIASASEDGSVRLWWPVDGAWNDAQSNVLRGHQAPVYRVAFSPNGRTIASAGADDTIRFWSADGTLLDTFTGHQDEVLSIEFSSDGKTLVSSSKDKTVRLWQVESQVKVLPHNYRVYDVGFTADGSMVASSGQNTIRLWRTKDGTAVLNPPITQPGTINSISLAAQGNMQQGPGQLLAAADNNGKIKLWNIRRQQTGYGAIDAGSITKGHNGAIYSVSLNPTGTLLASAGADGSVNLWQLQQRNDRYQPALIKTFAKLHPGGALSVSFSPDGKLLASSGADGVVHVWRLALDGNRDALQPYRSSKWHTGAVYSVSFSPNSHILASAGQDRTVQLWNLTTMQVSPQVLTGHSDEVLKVSFSPKTNLLASASRDDTIKLWTIDGNLVTTLIRHRREVSSVQFSPDGKTLASASYDNLALLWQLSNTNLDQLLQEGCRLAADFLQAHATPAASASASPESGSVTSDVQTFCQKTLDKSNQSNNLTSPPLDEPDEDN